MSVTRPNKMIYFFVMLVTLGISVQVFAERFPLLPAPFATKSTPKPSTVIGWPVDRTPIPAAGFKVSEFTSMESPRSLYRLPSGDVLVSQAKKTPMDNGENSPNQIMLLKINNGKLVGTSVFLSGLHLPFGMAVLKDQFFVGEPTRILKYKYKNGEIVGEGKVIAELPFPKPQRHWTRHLLINPQGTKLYVSIGSVSNVGENNDPLDARTAAILEMNLDGTQQKIYASGLRNAVSMAWEPRTKELWTTVNERDELGDGLVPDYITAVHRGEFYGWPYAYWGKHEDPRRAGERPDLVAKSMTPYFSVGTHTASLGITFTIQTSMPATYNEGALIAQHGSWNHSELVGYAVRYVTFKNGKPIDEESDFLTGFIADRESAKVYGRPVATVILADGSVLVSDDGGGKIWRVYKD